MWCKVNIAFGFVLKKVEDGMCRYFYAHENNTIMEKSKLVCTLDDIVNLKEKIQKMDIIDLCTRENQYKMEILQTCKCDSFCRATQKNTNGL